MSAGIDAPTETGGRVESGGHDSDGHDDVTLLKANHFASLLQIRVPADLLGTDLQFIDLLNPHRIAISATGRAAAACGAKVGDIVVAPLPRGKSTTSEDLVRISGKAPTTLLLSSPRRRFLFCGAFKSVEYGAGLQLDWGLVQAPECVQHDGRITALLDMGDSKLEAARRAGLERGDVLVGVDGEPFVSDDSASPSRLLEDRLKLGDVHVDVWRCTDSASRAALQRACVAAGRARRAVNAGPSAGVQLASACCFYS
ncbi:hypothetical protein M885DRAFT_528844 [Pelagophyceae sp. CCMP2097]|nr:hypothetical protein M885DRAFT_528844 [Pelagophyceae sp. CCMP2097]